MSSKLSLASLFRLSSWSHAVAIGSFAIILSACTDYVDDYEGNYKETYGNENAFIESLNKMDWDWAATCETGDWLWCFAANGAYNSKNDGLVEAYANEAKILFTETGDNGYENVVYELGDDLLPILRHDGGIGFSMSGGQDGSHVGVMVNVADLGYLLNDNNLLLAYENGCSGVTLNTIFPLEKFSQRSTWSLPISDFQILELDPETASFSNVYDGATDYISIDMSEDCPDGKNFVLVGIGLKPVKRSSSSTEKSSSSGDNGGSANSSSSSAKSSSSDKGVTTVNTKIGICYPAVSSIKAGESVSWKYYYDKNNYFYDDGGLENATFKWSFDGGMPSSGGNATVTKFNAETNQISYSGYGTKHAWLTITSKNYTGTLTCSTLDVVRSSDDGVTCANDDLWCKNQTGYRVITGLDAGGNTSGYWFDSTDIADGGASSFDWPVARGNYIKAFDEVIDYCGGLCGTYTLDKGEMTFDPYVYVGFNVAGTTVSETKPVSANASGWGGVCITYTSDVGASLQLDLGTSKNGEIGYDLPFASLSKTTSPKETCFAWSQFKQAGWGSEISGDEASKIIVALNFKIQARTGATGNFKIIRLRKYPEGISSSSSSSFQCGDLWCGATDTEGRVATGFDDANETSGYWYGYDDGSYGGSSKITYPADVSANEWDNFFGPLIEAYGGIKASMEFGSGYEYPYLGFGFNVVGENQIGADITDWEGVCLVYESTLQFYVELGPEDESTVTEYNNYKATVPRSGTAIKVVDLPWSKFYQERGWGKITDRDAVIADVATIRLYFPNTAGTTGNVNIRSIGRLGTCGSSSSTTPSSSSSIACGDLWCGKDHLYQVDLLPDGDGEGGYWLVENDGPFEGTSDITWPVALGNGYSAKALDPVIDYADAVSGTVSLGSGYDYPYVFLGFYMNGDSSDVDITAWEGICLVYKTTLGFSLTLASKDEATVTEYNNYKAVVSKSANPTVVNLPWSKFKQEVGWGQTIAQATALASVGKIYLNFSGSAGTTGDFSIYSIGRLNTCQ